MSEEFVQNNLTKAIHSLFPCLLVFDLIFGVQNMNYVLQRHQFSFFLSKQTSGNVTYRHFASSADRKRSSNNYGMVNKNRTEKVNKEQPTLTIYPFSIDELKEPKLFYEAIDKNVNKATEIQTGGRSLAQSTQNGTFEQNLNETQQETGQIVNRMHLNFIFS